MFVHENEEKCKLLLKVPPVNLLLIIDTMLLLNAGILEGLSHVFGIKPEVWSSVLYGSH